MSICRNFVILIDLVKYYWLIGQVILGRNTQDKLKLKIFFRVTRSVTVNILFRILFKHCLFAKRLFNFGYIFLNMKFKFLFAAVLVLMSVGFVAGESYTPQDGVFAYQEVENYTLNGFNFTILSSYNLAFENETHMFFNGNNNTLNISVTDSGNISEVNSTENVTASQTMLGSVEGYLLDRNGSYTFSFTENNTLISVSSKDMSLMMGVIGRD